MTGQTKAGYLDAVRIRYKQAIGRAEKKVIISEVVANLQIHEDK
ncbi:MAG: hypothetical protein US54_C0013G0001 [Candidatus Roizmanbacteria bacterium GW2011_GWA2_37_7]|uniref:Uncharacterized protein n=1 Tax=Candidatus Roizmanbacteria bacterium GW2011_GWA2_37_7 TaxID=1618481 RepID=A0A0G0H4U0_9BACT|nr:MAG: hypothetical protein US54_C0013G0001 [Candidatus Roizmanbacteria bacterium GW2011_GWA2_37_7]